MESNPPPSRLRAFFTSYTTAHQSPFALFLRILRTLILILATANLCALFAGLQILPPYKYIPTRVNFQDTSHLALNAFIFLAAIYSFFGRAEWSLSTRLTTGLVLAGWCLALNINELKNILEKGGCASGAAFNYRDVGNGEEVATSFQTKTRCLIQMVVSSLSCTWALLLIAELFSTYIYRKRLMIKYNLDRPTELEAIPQVVHVYQPDLSLNAGENTPVGSNPVSATAAPGVTAATTPEELPAYEPRPTGPRVHIIDMTRMSSGPPPTTAPSQPTPEASALPPPSYQAPHY
ncbi:hypothetical protein FBU30_001746 [Linnemannia zychae]|nr:hypothetical protein FBU30_001746 [Linnemannia zychae]